jgi:tetratricopeptide (TPR) repeat protein
MPLAIELAAARVKVLTPAQILERLSQRLDLFTGGRDADPRQQTLRSTIEWSHGLLDPDEQRLLARLAAFAGGATLESAERVANADLDTLQSLVEKSLVRRADGRFWMYETIREFALERLDTSGEADAIRRRHAERFLELAEEAEPNLIREALTQPGPWQARIEVERDNIRAAMGWFEARRAVEPALRMAGALAWFFEGKGPIAEGRRYLESALALPGGAPAVRTKALSAFAQTAAVMGDLAEAKAAGEESLERYRELDDAWQIGTSVHNLGYIAAESGDWETARGLFEDSARLFREVGDENYALWCTRSLAWTYQDTGDFARAREIHEANLRRAREVGNAGVEATTLGALGVILLDEGRADEAFPYIERAYRIHAQIGEAYEVAIDVWRFAKALAEVGRAEDALELLSLSKSLRDELGMRTPWVEREAEETLDRASGLLDAATFDAAWDRGRRLTPDAAVAKALRSIE